jgi:ribonuclease P protein component
VKRKFRLTKSTDFLRVRRLGKSFAHPLIVLFTLPNDGQSTRFGIAAGRTVGKAVQRNRAKRLLREALRPLLPQIRSGWDVIIHARKSMTRASLQQTRQALLELLKRAGLISNNGS